MEIVIITKVGNNSRNGVIHLFEQKKNEMAGQKNLNIC